MTRTVDINQDHINGISRDDILATIEDLQTFGAVQPTTGEPYTYTLGERPLSTAQAIEWLRDRVAQMDGDEAAEVDDFYTPSVADEVYALLTREIRRARNAVIGGDDPAAYGQLLTELANVPAAVTQAVADVERLANHRHTFGADDYCTVCGLDGRS